MAKLVASNMKELEALIKQKVAKAMEESVAPAVKKLESANVDEFVYKQYDPKVYERRMDNGGLSDVNNMSHVISTSGDSVELQVDNNTMSNPEFMPRSGTPHKIAGEVEYGYDYDYGGYGEAFEEERPFIRETINELKYGKAKEFLVKGLKKQGLDAK